MSRLDRHVANVQGRMALGKFLATLAWSTLALSAAALLGVVVNLLFRIFTDYLPGFPVVWVIIGGFVGCVIFAGVWAYVLRPTRQQAAAAIDERLGLKEKFATAIYVRPSSDVFCKSAVRDAEHTADHVDLGRRFPIRFPQQGYYTIALAILAYLLTMIEPLSLFGGKPPIAQKPPEEQQQQAAKEAVARALDAVASNPQSPLNSNEEFRKLVAELKTFSQQPRLSDPGQASRRALQALQELQEQTAQDWDKARKFAEAQNAFLQSLAPPDDAKGPVGEARKEIAKQNFERAAEELKKAVENFDKMDQKQKEDQAKQMQQAANQLQQVAKNPQVQQQIQQQLQQMGANQQQAQQMAQAMQQAAAGNKQAQQQLQQMAQQLAQQMNNGQGANAQQQQQLQQALQQMQAQANAQGQANALAQAAQQMAQAMQQAQQQPGNNGQMNPQQAQQMAQAQQAMQQALQNMQGVKQDLNQMAKQMAQAQQAMNAGQQCANGQCNGGQPGNQQGNQGNQGNQAGGNQGNQGNAGNQAANQGNQGPQPGLGIGGNMPKETSPFGVKMEQSRSEDSDKAGAKLLGSYFVKDKEMLTGEQRLKLAEVAEKAQKEAADEVDTEYASRQAQKVAQEYFRTMSKENGGK